jgi:hypothetical protein
MIWLYVRVQSFLVFHLPDDVMLSQCEQCVEGIEHIALKE